jgi:hypothetical protein
VTQPAPATGAEAPIPPEVRARGGPWALAWTAVGCGALVLLCSGIGAAVLFSAAAEGQRDLERKLERRRRREQGRAEVLATLEALADEIRREADGELPTGLPQIAPKDPWGTPVGWERTTPLRGELTSAGADRRFGTDDDVSLQVRLE